MAHTTPLPACLASALLVTVMTYGIVNYLPVMLKESNQWLQAPVDPFTPIDPALFLGVEIKGKELIVRIYRSYAWPFAKRLELHVELCDEFACTSYFFKEKVPQDSTREYRIFPIKINDRRVKIKVTVMVEEALVVSELLEVDVLG